jgi:hypothetical protein
MTRPKRNYNRLAPSTWAEICALWEIGDVTLPELAERYSVSTRTLQTHFAKHKVEKGSKAAALATSVKEEIYDTGLGDKDLTIQRARETREKAYKNACAVEEQIMGTVDAMGSASSKTLGLTSKLKALALAAAGLERIHGLKFRALGLDKDLPIHDEMPVLTFRDLSDDEIKALHQDDDEDEAEPFVAEPPKLALKDLADEANSGEDDALVITDSDESEDIVSEGEEEEPARRCTAASIALGGRLVRGQLP